MNVVAGKLNVSLYFYVQQDASAANPGEPHTGMLFSDLDSASYMRQGGLRVDVTPITLGTVDAVHANGGFVEVDATNMPGVYRFDPPDAAFVAGVDQVIATIVPAASENATVAPLLVDLARGTDAITLTQTTLNAIADHVLRRSWANAEASSEGDAIVFRSLFGAVAKLVNRVRVNGANLEIMRDDDSTVLGTQALTTDASAAPITELDTV